MEMRQRSRSRTPFIQRNGEDAELVEGDERRTSLPPRTFQNNLKQLAGQNHGHMEATTTNKLLTMTTSDYFSDESGIAKGQYTKTMITTATPRNSIHPITTTTTTTTTTTGNNYNYAGIVGGGHNILEKSFNNKEDVLAYTSTPFSNRKSMMNRNYEKNQESESLTRGGGGGGSFYTNSNFKEITQNNFNAKREFQNKDRTMSTFTTTTTTTNTINNLSMNNLAYLEYKNAGEYWRKTPKTDYTYSKLSYDRRELAPGIVAMPNMSRYGLHDVPGQYQFDRVDGHSSSSNSGSLSRIGQYIWPSKNNLSESRSYNRFRRSSYASLNNSSAIQQTQRNQDLWFWSRIVRVIGSLLNKLKNTFSFRTESDVGRYTMYDGTNTTKYRRDELHKLDEDFKVTGHLLQRWLKMFLLLLLVILMAFLMLAGYKHYPSYPTEKFTSLLVMPFNYSTLSDFHLPDIDISQYINQDKLIEWQLWMIKYWNIFKESSIDYLLSWQNN